MVFRKTLENKRRLKKRRSNVMAYIMNINIQADEDIQYILRNIKKSDTGAYVFMSDNRESLINIFCEILRDINETIYTSNKSLDLIKIKGFVSEAYIDISSDCSTDKYSYELNYDDFSISFKLTSINVFTIYSDIIQIKEG